MTIMSANGKHSKAIYTSKDIFESPNWSIAAKIKRINNDRGITRDGKWFASPSEAQSRSSGTSATNAESSPLQ
jgi:hypothetical protein